MLASSFFFNIFFSFFPYFFFFLYFLDPLFFFPLLFLFPRICKRERGRSGDRLVYMSTNGRVFFFFLASYLHLFSSRAIN